MSSTLGNAELVISANRERLTSSSSFVRKLRGRLFFDGAHSRVDSAYYYIILPYKQVCPELIRKNSGKKNKRLPKQVLNKPITDKSIYKSKISTSIYESKKLVKS